MNPLVRKTVASTLAAALAAGSWPRGAWADPPAESGMAAATSEESAAIKAAASGQNGPSAAAARRGPSAARAAATPAQALQQMQQWGVFKGDGDVLKTYLGDDGRLTPLGASLYVTLTQAHDPKLEKGSIMDEVAALKPTLDRLRESGPYDERKAQSIQRTIKLFESKFGKVDAASDGSVGDEYQRGALRESLMNGAAIVDPPKQSDLVQVKIKDGFEFWDKNGLAYRINAQNATTYNRELQKAQRAMNQSRPPEVAFIPETGRYNAEMFDYSYYRLKDQYDALVEGLRRDRVIALAELLGVSGKYREDMWFTNKRIQADLEAEAKSKTYTHRGRTYNVLDLVDGKFKQRQIYLEAALKGIERYKSDRAALATDLKDNPVISDGQVQSLSLDEQYTLRFLSLGVLETQSFYVKNQIERLDPSSPDAAQVMKAIDQSDLTPEQKASYKLRAQGMVNRLHALDGVLEKTRSMLSASDYAGSLDMANAALSSSQRELGLLGSDYSMFVEIPSVAFMGKQQADVSWMNFGAKFTRWAYKAVRPGSDYTAAMKGIDAGQAELKNIAILIAEGKNAEARQAIIAMNPGALKGSFAAAVGADTPRITDAARLAASLKVNRDRIGAVFETNKWLDTTGTFITWTVDMAVAAPALRMGFNGIGQWLGRYTGEAAAGEVSALSRYALVRRPAIVAREILLHSAARLQSLDPDAVWVRSQAGNWATQTMLATTMRAGSVALRQAAFTGMSAGISGTFALGQHLWDVGSQKVFAPGKSATVDLPYFGSVGIRPSASMFNSDFQGAMEAFWTGAKGGAWWANTMMDVHGVPLLHPGMLGYVGLPTTAFRDTSLMRYAELIGARGVVGSGLTAGKWMLRPAAAAAVEGSVERGFLEKLALQGAAGKGAAFALGMADNVAKYALFSDAVGWVGNQYAYHWSYGGEENLERRIKGANIAGQEWLASPAWMLIPTYAAHPARDAVVYQRGVQGAEQYKAAGMEHEIANAEEGARLRFLKTPEIPLSQRIFEASLKSPETGDYFIVTKEMRREAIKSQMVASLGGEKAKPADINPLEFYRATKMADGANFINLKVNDEVRLVAHQDFVEALLADPVRAQRVLDAKLGSEVEGFGRVTPEVQKDVAVALYSSEMQAGKAMPKELAGRVNDILKPYLDANQSVKPYAEKLIKALDASGTKSEAFGAPEATEPGWALKDVMTQVSEWRAKPDRPYSALVQDLRKQADSYLAEGKPSADGKAPLKLSAEEHGVLIKMYDYLDAIEERFNAFNNVEKAHGLAGESLEALKVQYSGHQAAEGVLKDFSSALDQWAAGHGPRDRVDGPASDGSYKKMVRSLAEGLEKSKPTLTPSDFAAMKGALDDMAAAPWVLHDSKGSALPSWRPEQFESFMGTLTSIAQQGRGGAPVRLFQMLKTGGGKTMLTFEGLLPLVEADGAARKMQPMFLTVQSNLEAQGRMEFIAYKKIGSNLQFDTYEGFKTKIAEGKTKGKNALRDYWILGDEMDGAALQPALTIGQVTGGVTRRSPIYNRVEEVDTGIANRLFGGQTSRDVRVQTEARRVQNAVNRIGGGSDAVVAEGARLENATGRLREARGPESRRAALAEVRDGVARMEGLLNSVPSRDADAVLMARQALGRLKESLSSPVADAGLRADAVRELETGFTREENLLRLTGSEQGLGRLTLEAGRRGAELEGRIGKLTTDIREARESKAPGASERVSALGEELALARQELALVDRFRSTDAGQRLATLQEKIAAAEGEPGAAPAESLTTWKSQAASDANALSGALRETAKAHAESLAKLYKVGGELRELDGKVADAVRRGQPAEELKASREALQNDFATARAEAARLKAQLSAGSSTGDLGSMMSRLHSLRGEGGSQAAAERAALLKTVHEEVRSRLSASADDVIAAARDGKAGWENSAVRLLERRRQMMEAFAGDENPMYTAFRDMKDDMQSYAMNQALRSPDPAVYKPAQETLLRMVDGRPLTSVPLKTAKMAWEVFTGRDVDVPIDQVGLTRLHAAKMLKALLSDPTMPVHQRDNLFWSLSSSLLSPGSTGRSSWVRTELLRQLHGFYEDPAGIRLDNRTGRINVVHNGQWFESMDNETRRFWELEYGVDLTLPYTNSSISTIKDVTTDKKARFISFSGTAGEKLREHFRDNGIRIEGEGSKPPQDPDRVVVSSLDGAPEGVRQAIETRLGRQWTKGDVVRLSDFSDASQGAARQWLESQPRASSVEMDVVAGPTDRFSRIGQALADVNASRGKVVVESLNGASPAVRDAIEKKIGGKLTGPRVLKLSEFEGPQLAEARDWLDGLRERSGDVDHIVLRRGDSIPLDVKPAIDAYLSGAKLAGKDEAVVRISDVKGADEAKTNAAQKWLRDQRAAQADNVYLRRGDAVPAEAKPAIDAYLRSRGFKMGGIDEISVKIGEVQAPGDQAKPEVAAKTEAARKWLRELRPSHLDSSLTVLSVSDTRVLKMVREYLTRVQGIKEDEIAMVFSDSEYLRNNVPEAQVAKQMNLDALNNGKARVLILDTRVGGRGLDLNFKGERGSLSQKAFRGYTNYEMLIVDPQKMSQVHLLQAEGRIDVGRVLPGAERGFSLLMDVKSVQGDRVFREMVAQDPFFSQVRSDPKFVAFEKSRGVPADWALFHDYIRERAADGTPDGALLAEQYQDTVKRHLETQQGEVEENQLRSSSVLTDAPRTGGRFPGIEGMR